MADAVYFNVAPNFDLHMFAGQLAEKYRTTVKQLQSWNGIANANLIYVGQKIRVK